MSYFSRLTDIVTCNISDMLRLEDDPKGAIRRIIEEMEEGLGGARRSVATAAASVERLESEIAEHQKRVEQWINQAKTELAAGRENAARTALLRKRETEDLIAGLRQQLAAAQATQEHLTTTLRALEARLTEARRTMQEVEVGETVTAESEPQPEPVDADRAQQVEAELEALRRSLSQ